LVSLATPKEQHCTLCCPSNLQLSNPQIGPGKLPLLENHYHAKWTLHLQGQALHHQPKGHAELPVTLVSICAAKASSTSRYTTSRSHMQQQEHINPMPLLGKTTGSVGRSKYPWYVTAAASQPLQLPTMNSCILYLHVEHTKVTPCQNLAGSMANMTSIHTLPADFCINMSQS
jgi:hypothetical protein